MRAIGILGGTFDPIHYGHIRLGLEIYNQLQLDHVKLIPLKIPPHRSSPVASSKQRCEMLQLAVKGQSGLCVDIRELESDDVSYTINTLKSLRQENAEDSLCLILGMDAFNKINTWKDWQKLLDYAHIIVANRPDEPDFEVSSELKQWIKNNLTDDPHLLQSTTQGYIYFMKIPMLDVSSSRLRSLFSQHQSVDKQLPENIISYIKENRLYLETA